MLSNKVKIFIYSNIGLFILLYLFLIFPFRLKYPIGKNAIVEERYHEKISIDDIPKNILYIFQDVDFKNNQYVEFRDYADIEVVRYNRHWRAWGTISLFANYNSIDDYKSFLITNNISNAIDGIETRGGTEFYKFSWGQISIANNVYSNSFIIRISTNLPYNAKISDDSTELVKYFLKKNELNYYKLQTKINNNWLIILFIILIYNLSLALLCIILKNKNRKNGLDKVKN